MVSALQNDQRLALVVQLIDEPVFLIDAPRPAPGKIEAQRFRFADAFKGVPHGIAQQFVDPPDRAFVRVLPVEVVFPRLRRPM